MNFRFLSYELNDLAQNSQIRLPEFYMSAAAKKDCISDTPRSGIGGFCQALSHKLIDKPDATIVDMGAGHGQMRRYCAGSMPCLSPEYPFGSQHWIGLDKAPQAELSTAGYDQIVECDFDKPLPLQSSSADALICIHVMEHLPRPEFTMSEIARVLALAVSSAVVLRQLRGPSLFFSIAGFATKCAAGAPDRTDILIPSARTTGSAWSQMLG